MNPPATVVMLNRNGGSLVRRAAESILAQSFPDFELLVVDNGSTDGSVGELGQVLGRDPRGFLIRSATNLGCAGGRNLAIQRSRGEIVCFVDNDGIAEPDWLAEIVRHEEESPTACILASKLLLGNTPYLLNAVGSTLNYQGYGIDLGYGEPAEFFRVTRAPLYACGNGLAVPRVVFDRVGLFDEEFVNYYEDADLCFRARRAGYPVEVEPRAVIRHFMKKEGTNAETKVVLCERNRIRFSLLHFDRTYLRTWLRKEAEFLWTRSRFVADPGRAYHRAWLWNLLRLPATIRKRRRLAGESLNPWTMNGVQPKWGFPSDRGYNLVLPPLPFSGESSPAEAPQPDGTGGWLYGWYMEEQSPVGPFRWSDGFAAYRIRTGLPAQAIQIAFCFPPLQGAAPRTLEVFWSNETEQAAGRARFRDCGVPEWREEAFPARIPPGETTIHVVTWPSYSEHHLGGRILGVGVRRIALSSTR